MQHQNRAKIYVIFGANGRDDARTVKTRLSELQKHTITMSICASNAMTPLSVATSDGFACNVATVMHAEEAIMLTRAASAGSQPFSRRRCP